MYTTMQGGDDNYTLELASWLWNFLTELVRTETLLLTTTTGGYTENQGLFLSLMLTPDQWTVCKDCLESTTNATAGTPFPLKDIYLWVHWWFPVCV